MFLVIRDQSRWEKQLWMDETANDADPMDTAITSFSLVLLRFVREYGGERGIRMLDRAFDPITV
jgi:hypothetical protein